MKDSNSPNRLSSFSSDYLDRDSEAFDSHDDVYSKHGSMPQRRTVLQSSGFIVTPNATWTNETFREVICANQGYTHLTLSAYNSMRFVLPMGCLNLSLTRLDGFNAIIPSFSVLPGSLTTLSVSNAVFAPELLPSPSDEAPASSSTPSYSSPGFNADGTIKWSEVWALFPSIRTFSLPNAGIRGSLPTSFPPQLRVFNMRENALEGTIPSQLFANTPIIASTSEPFSIVLSGNPLTGAIPSTLFLPLTGKISVPIAFNIYLDRCGLTGGLPPSLLESLQWLGRFTFDVSDNALNGSIPTSFIPSNLVITNGQVSISFSNNRFAGVFDPEFFASLPSIESLALRINGNQFTGLLPVFSLPNGWRSSMASLEFDFSNNLFSGTIPANMVPISDNTTFVLFSFSANRNQLEGTIPGDMFRSTNLLRDFQGDFKRDLSNALDLGTVNAFFSYFYLDLSVNRLDGSLPTTWIAPHLVGANTCYIILEDNLLSGPITDDLLSGSFSNADVTLRLANNDFHELPSFCPSSVSSLKFDASFNKLNDTLPESWVGCPLELSVAYNPFLAGTIPSGFLASSYSHMKFNASHTGLSGPLIASSGLRVRELDLSHTNINFCTSYTAASVNGFNPMKCILNQTDVCPCASQYPLCSQDCSSSPPPLDSPLSSPSPTSALNCPPNTRPSANFSCVNGIWTSTQPITSPTFAVPSGVGSVLITSNITSSTIIFNGLGSIVNVSGCASNLTSIIVELSESDLEKLGKSKSPLQRLLVLSHGSGANDSSCTDLSHVIVASKVKSSSCKKVKVEKAVIESDRTLGAYFSVDSSSCNRWWIILVSVVAAIVIIGAIVGAVAITLWNRHKELKYTQQLASCSNTKG